MLFEHTCKQCGKVNFFFPSQLTHQRTGERLYCSNACRGEANALSPLTGCRWCGEQVKRRSRKFCSRACRGHYQQALKIPKGQKIGSDTTRVKAP